MHALKIPRKGGTTFWRGSREFLLTPCFFFYFLFPLSNFYISLFCLLKLNLYVPTKREATLLQCRS